jgi:sulfate permease, SulP family
MAHRLAEPRVTEHHPRWVTTRHPASDDPASVFSSLRGYRGAWLRGDVIAGLTVWAVLVPEALAYATIAGVSPVVGLYAAPPALILYSLLGSSRHLVVGPMSATAALSAAAIAQFATQGSDSFVALTAALAIVTGITALIAGLLRLGFLANFISEPVLKGFIVGLALTIIMGQVPKLFGVEKGGGEFFSQLWHFLTHLGDTSGLTLLVGAISLAVVLALRRVAPVVPASLVAVALGVALVKIFDLDQHGVGIVGHIDSGLPSFAVPDVGSARYADLIAPAFGVALVGFAEGLGAAKTYAARMHYEVDTNRELLGLGAANLGAGLSSGMVVNGSLSKTAVNGSAGAHTQLSGLVCAALTVVTLLLLTGLFEDLPEATLAAVVIAAVVELVDIPALERLYRVRSPAPRGIYGVVGRPDFLAAIAALIGVLAFGTLPGLFIGIAISLLLLVYRASRPHVAVLGEVPGAAGQWTDVALHPDNEEVAGVVVARVESGLYFFNAEHIRTVITALAARDGTHAVVLDAASVPSIDVSAAQMLATLRDELARRHVRLLVVRAVGQVREVLEEAGVADELGTRHVFPSVSAAVQDAAGAPAGGG